MGSCFKGDNIAEYYINTDVPTYNTEEPQQIYRLETVIYILQGGLKMSYWRVYCGDMSYARVYCDLYECLWLYFLSIVEFTSYLCSKQRQCLKFCCWVLQCKATAITHYRTRLSSSEKNRPKVRLACTFLIKIGHVSLMGHALIPLGLFLFQPN